MEFFNNIINLILYFSITSFMGWCIETIYRSIRNKKFINPGFLYGPFLPIYGFGAIFIYLADLYLGRISIFLKIPLWFIITSALEYISSWILEKIFSLKLWDYSNHKFNLNGRISLTFSIIWTLFSAFAIYVVQPAVFTLIGKMDVRLAYFLAGQFVAYFIIDCVFSAKLYAGIIEFIKFPDLIFARISENISKLPFYLRRMIRPLVSFPNLMKEVLFRQSKIPKILLEEIKKRVYGKKG
ncbi:MAG: putative ABC transporter permease [Brevinematia bacterium]